MSRIAGRPPASGTPIAIGLVESRRSLPPNGATRCAPDVLRKCSDTCPASAAISAQSPSRPRWPQLRRPIIAMPVFAAFAMPSLRREFADDLPEAAIAVDDRDRVAVEHDRRRRVRLEPAVAHPFEVLARRAARRANRARRGSSRRAAARSARASAAPQPPPSMIAATSSTSFGAGDRSHWHPINEFPASGVGRRALEEIEVAALVGLRDVLLVERAEAALVARRRRLPRGAAARELGVAHLELELARRHVELDQVAVPHERERTADERLRRDVQHARAVARAAHPRVGDRAPCRARLARESSSESAAGPTRACRARPAGPACCSTSTESLVTSSAGSSMRAAMSL